MLIWLLALAAGAAAALWTYGTRLAPPLVAVAAVLRGLAVAGAVALLLDATAGARRAARPIVALDASASWGRGRGAEAFDSALALARSQAGDAFLLFGDSMRQPGDSIVPRDRASRLRPVVERAAASGRPLVVVTDGELDDPASLASLATGSRVELVRRDDRPDAGVSEIRAPRAVVAGDTIELEVGIVAGGAGAGRGLLAVDVADRRAATLDVDSLGPHGERLVRARLRLPQENGSVFLRAVLAVQGDAEPRNDTVTTTVEVSPAAGAVVVSTAPDLDVRELAAVLRGTVSLPTRGFYRVAPGVWREEGTLAAASEEAVRRVAREAPLLVLHGDTAIFGEPRALARGSLLLVAPPSAPSGEWYATGAPVSPVTAVLSGSPWDSLPPLEVAAELPRGEFEVLEARRGRRMERRVAAVGWERPRRVVVVGASGFWRWRFRGGVGPGVHAAFWGGLIDWLAAERADVRAAVPADGSVREGERIRWRRGSATDTLVTVHLTSEAPPRADSLVLRFPAGTPVAETAPLPAGRYRVTTRGGASALVVNASAELLPRRPTVAAGSVGTGTSLAEAPRLRGMGWIFAVVIAALCAEWIVRRRVGRR